MYEVNSLTPGGALGRAVPTPNAPIENAVEINSETMKLLWETAGQMDNLIYKIEGPRPSDTPSKVQEAPPRGILHDARVLRGIASSLLNRVTHLHDLIGVV